MKVFEKGSRVVFLGDSITAADNYCSRIADYYLHHLPEQKVKFFCAGISGGNVSTGLHYLEADLLPMKPDYVSVMYGVNDSRNDLLAAPDSIERTEALNRAFDAFRTNLEELIARLTERGIKVVLCTPPPYAEYFITAQKAMPGGYALIHRYAEQVRKTAREHRLELVDIHRTLAEIYLIEPLYDDDHVHPNDAGHARIADCYLAAQGLPTREFVCGEVPPAISAELAPIRELCSYIRKIYDVDSMIIHNDTLSDEVKLEIIADYVSHQRWEDTCAPSYFELISKLYSKTKPHQSEYVAEIDRLTSLLYEY